MSRHFFLGNSARHAAGKSLAAALLSLISAFAFAQVKPDAGQLLEQQRQPLRLPPPSEPDVRPRPPEPKPALPAQPQLRVKVSRFTFAGNTIYSDDALREAVEEFVGKELNFDALNDAATKVRAYYRSRGYFLAQAYLPEQAIRQGVVQIGIIEGRIGVRELDRGPQSRLSRRLLSGIIAAHLEEGDIITEVGLERPLLLINDLPTAQVISEIRPSRTVGAADLRVNVDQSTGFVNGFVDFDNQGNRFTGEYRTGASLNLNNATTWGDQMAFRGFTSDGMRYGRAAWLVPVWYYGTRLGVSYTKFDYTLGKNFSALLANGEGEVSSVYAFHPMIRTRNTNLILQAAYEKKELIDRVDSTPTFEERSIVTRRFGLVGDFRDGVLSGGLNSYSLNYTQGDLKIAPATVAAADAAATGLQTHGEFYKFNIEARRLQRLSDSMNLLIAVTDQRASKNLASAEKMSLGGPNAVRAYPVGEDTGDSGTVVQSELRYIFPNFKIVGGDLTLMTFFDYGAVKVNQNPLPTDTNNYRSISGYGVGFSVGKEGDFILRASFARKGSSDEPQADPLNRDPRIWVQAVKWF
jgi:hemolysin activation/secretion protein